MLQSQTYEENILRDRESEWAEEDEDEEDEAEEDEDEMHEEYYDDDDYDLYSADELEEIIWSLYR